jgi:hypothetical protein
MIINDPKSSERHTAIDLQVVKRISDNWQFLASYTARLNDAEVGPLRLNRAARYNRTPEINTGDQSTQRTFRCLGFYRLPYWHRRLGQLQQLRAGRRSRGRSAARRHVDSRPF